MIEFDDLTERELAFRASIGTERYSRWAAKVRARWERENIVWFHGTHRGRAIWLPERPLPDPDEEQSPRCKSRSSIGDDSK